MLRIFGRHVRQQFVGYLALFIALGGVSYAAVTLPRNSVGTAQIKPRAVKSSDLGKNAVKTGNVKDGSLLSTDFKPGQLVAGAPGPAGPTGSAGPIGPKGTNGTNGTNFTIATTLTSGQTEKGDYSLWGSGPGYIGAAINYRVPLAAPLDAAHVVFNANGATSTHCSGSGNADAGYLCVYELQDGNSTFRSIFRASGSNGSDAEGFEIFFDVSSSGGAWSYGDWAVTAP